MAVANSVYKRSHQCDIFIEPEFHRFGLISMKDATEIFEIRYKTALGQKEKLIALVKLNNTTFNFDNICNSVTLNYSANKFIFQRYGECSGNIIFSKVQKITSFTIGDGSPNNPIINPFIISGHFNFTINGTNNYKVEDGSFDMVLQWETNLMITQ